MQFRHHTKMLAALTAGAALTGILTAGNAVAEDAYPSHPIRIIVPFAAGGGPDIEARKLAVPLAEALNGNIVVENRVGAAGIIAAEVAAQAPPDGYTLLYGSSSQLIQKILKPKATFDPEKSFAPITLIATSPGVLVVANTSPIKTVQDLAAAARARPGELNYSSGGIGTAAHLAGATFCVVTKIDAVHVPLRGSVEILQSLVGGITQFAFPVAGTGVPQVKSGRLRGLAVTSRARMKQLPDLPSLFEVYKDESLVQESWDALWAPAGTPVPIINKLFAAAVKASQNPAFHAQVESQGSAVVNSKSPADLAAYMHAENAKWNKIIQLAKIPTE